MMTACFSPDQIKSWTPSGKTFWIRAWVIYVFFKPYGSKVRRKGNLDETVYIFYLFSVQRQHHEHLVIGLEITVSQRHANKNTRLIFDQSDVYNYLKINTCSKIHEKSVYAI